MNKKWYILITLIILFLINTFLVIKGYYTNIDAIVHNFILQIKSGSIDKLMHILTFFGSTKFMVLLCLVLFIIFLIKINKKYAFSTAGILIVSTIINNIIKPIIKRGRPEYITVIENTFSYPSGHMMASTTLYGFIVYMIICSKLSKRLKSLISIFLVLLIIFVGISRIYLGAHYFSDILGASLVSASLIIGYAILNDKYHIL